jgi:hypothetical protein
VYNDPLSLISANMVYDGGTTIIMNSDKFVPLSQNLINGTYGRNKVTFNGTDTYLGKCTGEGTYNSITGTFEFYGASTAKGNFTGTYDTNTKEGTITFYRGLLAETTGVTVTYDEKTKNLTVSIVGFYINI